eukprot:753978_1
MSFYEFVCSNHMDIQQITHDICVETVIKSFCEKNKMLRIFALLVLFTKEGVTQVPVSKIEELAIDLSDDTSLNINVIRSYWTNESVHVSVNANDCPNLDPPIANEQIAESDIDLRDDTSVGINADESVHDSANANEEKTSDYYEIRVPNAWTDAYCRIDDSYFDCSTNDKIIFDHDPIVSFNNVSIYNIEKNPSHQFTCSTTNNKINKYPGSIVCVICNCIVCWHCSIPRRRICKSCELYIRFRRIIAIGDRKPPNLRYEGYFMESSVYHPFSNASGIYGPVANMHLNTSERD